MTKPEQHKIVQNAIMEILGSDEHELLPEAKLVRDLGMDSLDAVEIVMQIEKDFNITVNDDVLDDMITVFDVHRIVEDCIKAKVA